MRFEGNDFSKIMQKTDKAETEIKYFEKNEFGDKIGLLNAEPFLNIDTILISSRHLYRMPYSLHEKSGLVSLPINPSKVLEFEKEDAKPENVKVSRFRFLDRENVIKNETRHLIMQAFDFTLNKEEEIKIAGKREYEIPQAALKDELFPPCIKLILNGLEDGRKRALFILCNFLTSVGWDYSAMEKLLREWNKKNKEPLREVYLLGQIRHHKQSRKKILPPNCSNEMYMLGIGVCKPDNLCSKIKNPVSYALRKGFYLKKEEVKEKV